MREQLPIWILLNYLLLSNQCGAQNWKNAKVSLTLIIPFFVFGFLVIFGDKVLKILHNPYLHFARQDGQDRKKGKKIMQLK